MRNPKSSKNNDTLFLPEAKEIIQRITTESRRQELKQGTDRKLWRKWISETFRTVNRIQTK